MNSSDWGIEPDGLSKTYHHQDFSPLVEEPSKLNDWIVYSYRFIDLFGTMPDLDDVLNLFDFDLLTKKRFVDALKTIFLNAGWEGDGVIQVLWIPPFVFPDREDGRGEFYFHVKQSNNGFSWVACPYPDEHLEYYWSKSGGYRYDAQNGTVWS